MIKMTNNIREIFHFYYITLLYLFQVTVGLGRPTQLFKCFIIIIIIIILFYMNRPVLKILGLCYHKTTKQKQLKK